MTYVTLKQFVGVDEPGADALATGDDGGSVIAANGLLVVYGNGGAGKTTALVDMQFHLAAGMPWIGVMTPAARIRSLWIENEGPRPEFRKKLARKLAGWTGPDVTGHVGVYEDPWGKFSFRSDACRDELVENVNQMGAGLVIAGPLKTIGMVGAGTDDDIGDFLALVDDVRDRTGAAVALVMHENRAGQISGAWESRPDTLLHVQAQGHGRTRLFWQKARWCSALHGRSTNLLWADGESFTAVEREEVTEDTIERGILEAVQAEPGGSWRAVRQRVKGNVELLAKIRDRLLAGGAIVNTATRDGYFKLYLADDPAASGSDARTASEPLTLPLPTQDGEREWFHGSRGSIGTAEPEPPRAPGTGADVGQDDDDERTHEADDHDELDRLAAIGEEMGLA